MTKLLVLHLLSVTLFLSAKGQDRLEYLETNVPKEKFAIYGDSYLWTKGWWLVSSMLIDTSRNGNAIAKGSKLTKQSIDSLSKEFRKYLSPNVIRFGNLTPRVKFYPANPRVTPFIRSAIYEISDSAVKQIGNFTVEFGTGVHNSMADVSQVFIFKPRETVPGPEAKTLRAILARKATSQEDNITPPRVERN